MGLFGAIIFGLLLLTPLAAAPGSGTEALRLAGVLGLVALLMAAAALKAVRDREGAVRPSPLLTAAFLFLGVNVLSLAVAPSLEEALVPLATLAAGVAACALARGGALPAAFVLDAGLWIVAGLGLAVSALGLIQKALGMAAVGAEGNSNYSGTLAAMLLPVAGAAALAEGQAAWKRRMAGLSAFGLMALLVATESRGGLVGAGVGIAVAGTALIRRRVPRAAPATAAAVLLLVAAPLLFLGRRHLSPARAETASVRIGIWKRALKMAAGRPWLGAGVGGFAARFPPFRDPVEYEISNRDAGMDFKEVEDAHSIWVQVAAETGVPGLLTFLLVLYVAARLWRYYLRTAPDGGAAAALAGLGGGVAAFLAAGFFNTLTIRVSHTLLFWAFLGMIELAGDGGGRRRRAGGRQTAVAVPAAAALLALTGVWLAGTLAWMDRQFRAGMGTASALEREARFREALQVYPPYWPMRYEMGRALSALGHARESAAAFRAVLEVRPHQVAALNNLAVELLRTPDGEDEALRHLRHAVEVEPAWFLSHYNLGIHAARGGRFTEARGHFAEALRRNPCHARSSWSLGVTFLSEGDPGRAVEPFRRARDLGMDVAAGLRREHPSAAAEPRFAEFFR
jgi:O-antigen ligase/Flp pilus assembly protein TadD